MTNNGTNKTPSRGDIKDIVVISDPGKSGSNGDINKRGSKGNGKKG